ncbi:MAG: hypothetical protein C0456_13260 [Hyphomonas sp.]|nr:hypothetical protein [Hyphomonas sp.]
MTFSRERRGVDLENISAQAQPEEGEPVIFLPSKLTSDAARNLHAQVSAATGPVLQLDASKVDFLGAAALQVLISIKKSSTQDYRTIVLQHPSEAFLTGLSRLGANLGDVQNSEQLPCL